jgi:hypothetical protein
MRNTLMALTALAGLVGAGLVSNAQAAPSRIEGATVQTVQYYGDHDGWREREWRRHEHWRRWHHWHHWDHRG